MTLTLGCNLGAGGLPAGPADREKILRFPAEDLRNTPFADTDLDYRHVSAAAHDAIR